MKKHLFLLIATAILFSCKNEKSAATAEAQIETEKNPVSEFEKLNAELKKYEVPSQFFKVSSKKQNKVKSKLGTTIHVNPENLESVDGTKIGETIEVELKEITNQKALLKSNAQTISNGKLLVSGGAYYINMTSEGRQLKLKDKKDLIVDFPKLSDKEMSLFYGQKDSLGSMNWQPANAKFTSPKKPANTNRELDSLTQPTSDASGNDMEDLFAYMEKAPQTKEGKAIQRENSNYERMENKVYNAIRINKLGWINIDRFSEVKDKTKLEYQFSETNKMLYSNIYLIFKDMNSFIQDQYYFEGENYEQVFNEIPLGANVEVIAIAVKGNKKYSFKTALKMVKNEKINITLKETSDKEFDKLFQ
nr:hypothetical protein [uncultured Flavobacterium sp.]